MKQYLKKPYKTNIYNQVYWLIGWNTDFFKKRTLLSL